MFCRPISEYFCFLFGCIFLHFPLAAHFPRGCRPWIPARGQNLYKSLFWLSDSNPTGSIYPPRVSILEEFLICCCFVCFDVLYLDCFDLRSFVCQVGFVLFDLICYFSFVDSFLICFLFVGVPGRARWRPALVSP